MCIHCFVETQKLRVLKTFEERRVLTVVWHWINYTPLIILFHGGTCKRYPIFLTKNNVLKNALSYFHLVGTRIFAFGEEFFYIPYQLTTHGMYATQSSHEKSLFSPCFCLVNLRKNQM